MKKLAIALALTGAFASNQAAAWGNDGHRAIGAIADKLLKGSHAQKMIAEILLPGETLESVAVWADCVKGDWCGKQTAEMQAYVAAHPRHQEYHYTNTPFQHSHYTPGAPGTSDVDIVLTLQQAIAVLQGKSDAASNPRNFTKRQALLLIAHLAGDIHQPLHVGAAFVSKDGKFVIPKKESDIDQVAMFDSRGGNNLVFDETKIIPGEGTPQSLNRPLHSYWDTTVVKYAMRRSSVKSPEEFAQMMIDANPSQAAYGADLQAWPVKWANESLAASKTAFHGVTPGGLQEHVSRKGEKYYTFGLEVPNDYPVPTSALARTQLAKGGHNLAALLKAIWP
jgi:hypothetical protein